MKAVRDLLKHSSIYGLGQILSRFASVLLLPLYTRCLSPADYGIIATLDLTAGILGILIGSGVAQAVVRFHFEAKDAVGLRRVWWTGLAWVLFTATLVTVPVVLTRESLAELTLGSGVSSGGHFWLLTAGTMWFNFVTDVLETYLRVRKWSGLFVAVSLGRLLFNISMSVWFLVGLELGVAGQLLSNLIAAGVYNLTLLALFVRGVGWFAFDTKILKQLLRFGTPLIVTSMLSLLMHQADCYLLRAFSDMEHVGVYSLAAKIAQAINTLCLVPFSSIWNVVMYEIAEQPDSKRLFARVFQYWVFALMAIMLSVALFAHPLLPFLAPGQFTEAADLIAVMLPGFLLFALHGMFNVPALLAKKTAVQIPPSIVGVAVKIGLNILLIPLLGSMGAAIACVATYAAYSFTGLWFYRRIDHIPYPFGMCALAGAMVTVVFATVRFAIYPQLDSVLAQVAVATVVSLLMTLILMAPVAGIVIRELADRTRLPVFVKLARLSERLQPRQPRDRETVASSSIADRP